MYCDCPQFQRCCFCLPLRRGVLVIAYLKILFSAFMVGVYSYEVHVESNTELLYQGLSVRLPAEACVFIYCVECVFAAILIYGTHKRITRPVKVYYYFSICTLVSSVLMQIVDIFSINSHSSFFIFELGLLCFTGICIQLYLLLLVWNLLKKLDVDGPHVYDNQLHQFINGDLKLESNGVYNPSTIPVEV
ncbi:unnamed protein product [Diatraea saccharalis]|uniref:Uncharacterized protein n=1 Tax=Diatraea saccharalis TaxID=40085 RepID=A0A9N9R2T8_9NEOP|nr:unnamed protein product [Diatraea saccharalis]